MLFCWESWTLEILSRTPGKPGVAEGILSSPITSEVIIPWIVVRTKRLKRAWFLNNLQVHLKAIAASPSFH
jgi:hypothetical protein